MPYAGVPPARQSFSFASGETVEYTPISRFFVNRLRIESERALRQQRPAVPTIQTDFDPTPTPNPADPAYVAAMQAHTERVGIRTFQRAIQMAVVVAPERVAAGLAAFAAEQARFDAFLARDAAGATEATEESDPFDRYLDGVTDPTVRYVLLVAAGGDQWELVRLMQALYGMQTDEEAIQSALDQHKSDVPGAEPMGVLSASIGHPDPQS